MREISKAKMLREQADDQAMYQAMSTFGSDTTSLGASVAKYLYYNGLDCTDFVHWVEKEFEMLVADDSQVQEEEPEEMQDTSFPSTPEGLVQAIEHASSYFDETGGRIGEKAGGALLRQAVYVKLVGAGQQMRKPIDFIAYGIENGVPYFCGGLQNGAEYNYNTIDLNEKEIEVIKQLLQ